MDLPALQLFTEIARHGSIAATARARGMDPSAVSRRLAALEASLGVRLLDRTTRRLALTEAGRLVLERATGPLAELAALRESARDTALRPAGTLRLTASVAFADRWLLPRLATFRERHPKIALDLALTDATLDPLEHGLDLALRLGPEPPVPARKVMDTAYRVVVSPAFRAAHPAEHPRDLATLPTVAFPFPGYRSRWRFTARDGTTEDIAITPALTVSSALAIRTAALHGLGAALLADWTTAEDRVAGTLIDLFPDHRASASRRPTALWFLAPPRPPARTRAFAAWLDAQAARDIS